MALVSKNILESALLVVLFSTMACGQGKGAKQFADKSAVQQAREVTSFLRTHNPDQVRDAFPSQIRDSIDGDTLRRTLSRLPKQEPDTTELIGYRSTTFRGRTRVNISFQQAFGEEIRAVAISFQKIGEDKFALIGFNVKRLTKDQKIRHAFDFSDASILHYLILLYAASTFAFIIFSVVAVLWKPISGRTWLWVVFIIIGVGGVTFNWTTGNISVDLSSFRLLGVEVFSQGQYSPWKIGVNFPLGAIVFWYKYQNGSLVPNKESDGEEIETTSE